MVIKLGDALGNKARSIALRIKREYKNGKSKTKNWNAKKVKNSMFVDIKGSKKYYKDSGILITFKKGKSPYWYRADGMFIATSGSAREVFNN